MDSGSIQKIIIIDFGGQYAHLIASRIRRLGVYSEIFQNDCKPEDFKNNVKGIILSGGPSSISDANAPQLDINILKLGIPILGLCYGHQYIARAFGGEVSQGKHREYGIAQLMITKNINSPLFKGLSENGEQMWMSHGDNVEIMGTGFQNIGSTQNCENAALHNLEKKIFTLQFHPEVTHSLKGMTILSNFVDICECQKSWDSKQYTEILKEMCKNKILNTKSKVFMLVSGGVDSTVAFTLLNNALGKDKVYGLFIDNGLLRKNEFDHVNKAIKQLGYNNFHAEDCSQVFLDRLKEQYNPEKKRIIIGNTFIDVQKQVLEKLKLNPDEWILGQGTIYPDTIESKGTKNADLIKTHHNRVEVIQAMIEQGKIIEPLQNLYKDEVRAVGLELGLPESIVWRHPFPGPGLGVRCLCNFEENEQVIPNETQINTDLNKITGKFNIFSQILPVRSVGVQGDSRTYSHPAVLYIENEENQAKISWNELELLSTSITNYIKAVNRVILMVSSKNYKTYPTAKKTLHKLYINKQRLDVLREADDIAMNGLLQHNLMQKVWQMPTILLPYGTNTDESVILRPIFSSEAMTAEFAKLDFSVIKEISNLIISKLNSVSEVYFDLTNKPPGTIEWE